MVPDPYYSVINFVFITGVTAKLQWNNWFRGTLYALCGDRQAIYYAKSAHSNHYEDRIWHFYCKTVADYNYNHCYWTGYQNSYDKPLFAHCGANYMMRGIYSIYSNHHRDRLFQIQCCHAPHHYTRHCFLSGYVNGWDGAMNYGVGGRWAFTGLYSYHSNRREWVTALQCSINVCFFSGIEFGRLLVVTIHANSAVFLNWTLPL